MSIDSNEVFTNAEGGIAKMYKECKLYDSFSHRHNNHQNSKSYIRGLDKIDFLFCTYNILKTIILCGMTAFNEIIVSDHYGLFIYVKKDVVLKDKIVEEISPFSRKLQSNSSKVIRHYKKQLQEHIGKGNIEQRAKDIRTIATTRKLTSIEEKNLII